MSILQIEYKEEDGVSLYPDYIVEEICRKQLQTLIDTKDTPFIYVFKTSQEIVLNAFRALLTTEFQSLTYEDVRFFVEDIQVVFDKTSSFKWSYNEYPLKLKGWASIFLSNIFGLTI